MPSWNDGSSSSERLPDFTEMDYAPNTIEDPTFCGIAVGSGERCRIHHIEPTKCVAFEGINTGRRFYMCSVQNHVDNCGFHDWVDGDLPETLQNALKTLWGMYYSSNSARAEEKIEHGKFVEELMAEKSILEKKHGILLADVKKHMDDTEAKMLKQNYKKIMSGECDEVDELKQQVVELKQVRKTQADVMRAKSGEWDAEREALKVETEAMKAEKEALKDEKKKLEYMLFDLLKASEANKDKVKRIREVCDE